MADIVETKSLFEEMIKTSNIKEMIESPRIERPIRTLMIVLLEITLEFDVSDIAVQDRRQNPLFHFLKNSKERVRR